MRDDPGDATRSMRSTMSAARVAGLAYLVALVLGNFAEFYVGGRLIVHGDAAQSARNIVAHESLFRLGIASNLLLFATDVVLIAALYVVLERTHRPLAILAAMFRLIETSTLVLVTRSDLEVVRALSGADYLRVFEPGRLQALARLAIDAHGDAYNVALVFFGTGSAIFGALWWRSRLIPRLLAALGVVASALAGIGSLALIVAPDVSGAIVPWYFVPIFAFEIVMGVRLLFLPLRAPTAGRAPHFPE